MSPSSEFKCRRRESNTSGLSTKSSLALPLGYCVQHTCKVSKFLALYAHHDSLQAACRTTATAAGAVGCCNYHSCCRGGRADWSLRPAAIMRYNRLAHLPVGIQVGSGRLGQSWLRPYKICHCLSGLAIRGHQLYPFIERIIKIFPP